MSDGWRLVLQNLRNIMQLMVRVVQRRCASHLLDGSWRRGTSLLRGAQDDRSSRLGWVVAIVGVMLRVVVLLVGWVVGGASSGV